MNFDPFTTFNYNPTNEDRAFTVILVLLNVISHHICSCMNCHIIGAVSLSGEGTLILNLEF